MEIKDIEEKYKDKYNIIPNSEIFHLNITQKISIDYNFKFTLKNIITNKSKTIKFNIYDKPLLFIFFQKNIISSIDKIKEILNYENEVKFIDDKKFKVIIMIKEDEVTNVIGYLKYNDIDECFIIPDTNPVFMKLFGIDGKYDSKSVFINRTSEIGLILENDIDFLTKDAIEFYLNWNSKNNFNNFDNEQKFLLKNAFNYFQNFKKEFNIEIEFSKIGDKKYPVNIRFNYYEEDQKDAKQVIVQLKNIINSNNFIKKYFILPKIKKTDKQKMKDMENKINELMKIINEKEINNLKEENLIDDCNDKNTKKIEDLKNNQNSTIKEEEQLFPQGEQYYQLYKDSNINNKKNQKNRFEPFQIFFTLNDVFDPHKKYSFGISINNSSKIDNPTFLGYLENKTGNNIEFGTTFKIDYFFERNQTIIVSPIINGEETGDKIKYQVSELMINKENKLSKKIENIGNLQISYSSIKNLNNLLSKEISTFEFFIELNNKDFFGDKKKLHNSYFVIKSFKDGQTKRPVYKSCEYNFEINKYHKTSFISLVSDILCDDKNDSIFFELYCPSLNNSNYIGFCTFNLNQLDSNRENDRFLSINIKNNRYGTIGQLEINYNIEEKLHFEKYIKKAKLI